MPKLQKSQCLELSCMNITCNVICISVMYMNQVILIGICSLAWKSSGLWNRFCYVFRAELSWKSSLRYSTHRNRCHCNTVHDFLHWTWFHCSDLETETEIVQWCRMHISDLHRYNHRTEELLHQQKRSFGHVVAMAYLCSSVSRAHRRCRMPSGRITTYPEELGRSKCWTAASKTSSGISLACTRIYFILSRWFKCFKQNWDDLG